VTASTVRFAAILLAGALLRVIALPEQGTGDTTIWKVWAYNAARHDVAELYGTTADRGPNGEPQRRVIEFAGNEMTVDYPPLALYELGLVGRAYWSWSGRHFPNTAALSAFVKLPSVASEVGLVLLLFFAVRRSIGLATAQWAIAAYWLNPAALIDASDLGYLDPQFILPAAAAIVAAVYEWPAAAGALIAAAVLTKAQALFIAPAVALAVWSCGAPEHRIGRFMRFGTGGLACAAVIIAPVAIAGGWPNMVLALSRLASHDMLSANSCNLWWIAGYVLRVRDSVHDLGIWTAVTAPARILGIERVVELGYPNARTIGTALVAASTIWTLWTARRARDLWLISAVGAFVVHAYATLGAQVHENHMFAAVPLAILAASGRSAFRGIAAALSAIVALNLNLFYGFGLGVGYALPRSVTIIDATVVLALINCAALAWHAATLATVSRAAALEKLPGAAPAAS